MIAVLTTGGKEDFSTLGTYLMHGSKQNGNYTEDPSERVGFTATRNLFCDPGDRDAIVRMMLACRARTANDAKPALHLIVSWEPGDEWRRIPPDSPTQREMEDSVDYLLGELGLKRHMTWIVEHIDTDCTHVHALACGVHPRTRKMWNSSFSKARLFDACRELERAHGWRPATTKTLGEIWREEQPSLTYFEREWEALGREAPFSVKVRAVTSKYFRNAESWPQLVYVLDDQLDLFLEPRREAGMVLTTSADYIALSKIHPAFSRPKLEARFRMTWDEYRALLEAGYGRDVIHAMSVERQSQAEAGGLETAQGGEADRGQEISQGGETAQGERAQGDQSNGTNEPTPEHVSTPEREAIPDRETTPESAHERHPSRNEALRDEGRGDEGRGDEGRRDETRPEPAVPESSESTPLTVQPFEAYRAAYEAALRERDELPMQPPGNRPYSDDLKTPLHRLEDVHGAAGSAATDIGEPPPLSDLALEWDALQSIADDERRTYEELHERWEAVLADGAAAPRTVLAGYRRTAAIHGPTLARLVVLSSGDDSSQVEEGREEKVDHQIESDPSARPEAGYWMAGYWEARHVERRSDLQALHEEMTEAETRIEAIAVYRTELTRRVAEDVRVEPRIIEEAWTEPSQLRLYAAESHSSDSHSPERHAPDQHAPDQHAPVSRDADPAAQQRVDAVWDQARAAMDLARRMDRTSRRVRSLQNLVRKTVDRGVDACEVTQIVTAARRPAQAERMRAAARELTAMINLENYATRRDQSEGLRRAFEERVDELFEHGKRAEEKLVGIAQENGLHAAIRALANHPNRFGVLRGDQTRYREVCLDAMQEVNTTIDAMCKYREGGLARAAVKVTVADMLEAETMLEEYDPEVREKIVQDTSALRGDFEHLKEVVRHMPDGKALSSQADRLFERADSWSKKSLQEMMDRAQERIEASEEAERVLHGHSQLEAYFLRLYERPRDAKARFEEAAFPDGIDPKTDAFTQALDEMRRAPSRFGAQREGLGAEQTMRWATRLAGAATGYAHAAEDLRRRVRGSAYYERERQPRFRGAEALEAAKKRLVPGRPEVAQLLDGLRQDVRGLRDRGIGRW